MAATNSGGGGGLGLTGGYLPSFATATKKAAVHHGNTAAATAAQQAGPLAVDELHSVASV